MWKKISVGRNKALYDVIIDDYNDLSDFCDILADYILNKYPEIIITNMLKNEYSYFNSNEINKIINSVIKETEFIDKSVLTEILINYINTFNILLLDGFVLFRLSEYIQKLESAADKAARALMVQYEYDEFIELLKFFVDIQTPMLKTAHIIYSETKYIILDESFKEVTNDYIDDFLHELRYGRINYDDLLLSALITMAPSEIYIHNYEQIANTELLNTLKKIFNQNIHFCKSNEQCLNAINITENIINTGNISENTHLS